MTDSLGDRMKENYENRSRIYLTRRTPVIIRADGRAFHTLTHYCEKPFDESLSQRMIETTIGLCEEIQGAKCAYVQSDEISILITDYDRLNSGAWFDYNIQKMASVSASIATSAFGNAMRKIAGDWNDWKAQAAKRATFDSRVFNIPKEEVTNYFVWRQQDWTRNSLEMLARAHYSHKQLDKKNSAAMHEMLHEKGVNWADLPDKWKNGSLIVKESILVDPNQDIVASNMRSEWKRKDPCPIFKNDRDAIEKLLIPEEV